MDSEKDRSLPDYSAVGDRAKARGAHGRTSEGRRNTIGHKKAGKGTKIKRDGRRWAGLAHVGKSGTKATTGPSRKEAPVPTPAEILNAATGLTLDGLLKGLYWGLYC